METTAHIDFIAAAYAAAVIVVGALIVWVALDYRAQQRKIAELESHGVSRRSAASASRPASQAKDEAKQQAENRA
jgi:heme exporter protein D